VVTGYGLREAPHGHEHVAPIAPAHRVIGIDEKNRIKGGKRLFEILQFEICERAIAEGIYRAGVEGHSMVKTVKRLLAAAHVKQRQTPHANTVHRSLI